MQVNGGILKEIGLNLAFYGIAGATLAAATDGPVLLSSGLGLSYVIGTTVLNHAANYINERYELKSSRFSILHGVKESVVAGSFIVAGRVLDVIDLSGTVAIGAIGAFGLAANLYYAISSIRSAQDEHVSEITLAKCRQQALVKKFEYQMNSYQSIILLQM